MEIEMKLVYVLSLVDHNDLCVVGVFEARGLADMAKVELEAKMTEDQRDTGIFYCITAFEMGKVY